MITRLGAGGFFPTGGISPRQEYTRPAAGQGGGVETRAYDCARFSTPAAGEEARVRELTARLAGQLRVRPSRAELSQLQAQIAEGSYQPDAREIAARMLLVAGEG